MKNLDVLSHDVLLQMPGSFGIKDTEFKIRACNQQTIDMLGYKNLDTVIGLTDHDLPDSVAAYADEYRKQDEYVIEHGEINLVNLNQFPDGNFYAHIGNKRRLVDKQGKVQGLIVNAIEISASTLAKIFRLLHCEPSQKSMADCIYGSYEMINEANSVHNLSNREHQVLFYFIRGYSSKQIGVQLDISPRTVEQYVCNIKL